MKVGPGDKVKISVPESADGTLRRELPAVVLDPPDRAKVDKSGTGGWAGCIVGLNEPVVKVERVVETAREAKLSSYLWFLRVAMVLLFGTLVFCFSESWWDAARLSFGLIVLMYFVKEWAVTWLTRDASINARHGEQALAEAELED